MKSFKSYIKEQTLVNDLGDFAKYACMHLDIHPVPEIEYVNDKQAAAEAKSFGGYYPGEKKIRVNIAERHPVDIMRTLAHELVHHKQNLDGRLGDVAVAGETGSTHENEANSVAGVVMRNYGRANPRIYEDYAPTEA